jgi:hypothetical protein
MSCLTDYIGLKICGNENPESGVFINSLPGISIEMMDSIAESEQITFKGVWADVQTEAWNRFYIDFMDETNKCYDINPYCDYEDLICDNLGRLVNAWRYLLGNQLMLFRIYSPRINLFTTVTIDEAKELRDFYQVEYENALKQAVKLIDVGACVDCMQCGGNPQTVTWLP